MAIVAVHGERAVAAVPGEGFDVKRYSVALRPDLTSGSVAGRQTIDLRLTAPTQEIVFSPNGLRVANPMLSGVPLTVRADREGIAFVLPRAMPAGTRIRLSFTFEGVPARGITLVPAGLFTGYFGCDWMVCLQDMPGDKADMQLDLYLPSDAVSLGPGKRLAPLVLPDGLTLHRWRSVRPMSAYLFAFAAGDFPSEGETTSHGDLRYWNATGQPADLSRLFDETPLMAAFFADKAGIGLPEKNYDQLLVPGREAQEASGFALIGAGELEREAGDPATAWVIAHELAHQWWGNLVTCESWRDFWLNEGLATFMVAAWKEHRLGADAYRAEIDLLRNRQAELQARGRDKPLTWAGKYPSLGYRRAVQYSKGALFIATLRQSIGDAAFWQGLRAYTMDHAGQTVTSRDFQTAMERASGRDLGTLFDRWVYPGAGGAEQ